MMRLLVLGIAALALLLASAASAHKPSDSYLTLSLAERQISGRWDIALRDLEHALGLDRDGDGAITWGEVRAQHAAIAAYALARLELASGGAGCPPRPIENLIERHSDGAYAVLRFVADCPRPIAALDVTYNLLFDLDPLHRGLVRVQAGDVTHSAVLGPHRRYWQLSPGRARPWETLATYVREGVWHIWLGLDHILFLISLLLPAVLRREDGRWQPIARRDAAILDIVRIVSAFTLAHSLTLALAALGVVELPSRLVEGAIAVSVIVAALNNLWPVVTRRLWLVAFGFGLIHGFGFASVLADLGLPQGALLVALLGFNLGVEIGQLAIVAALMPLAWALRETWLYPRLIVRFGSLLIVAAATAWLLERGFGVALAG
jgi:HupE / UreJ protein